LLCVHCHWPHAPKFAALTPLPPPVRPEHLGAQLLQRAAASAAMGNEQEPAAATRSDDDE
jgi:hypothetical protein